MLKHFAYSFQRELHRIVRHPTYIIVLTLGIAFCYVFFLTMMNEGQPSNLPIAVVDMDGSFLSRRLCHELEATQGVTVATVYNSHVEARKAMQRGDIYAFIEIPKGTYEEILSFKTPHLSMYINNAYMLGGSLSWRTLLTMSNLASGAVQREVLRKQGYGEAQIMGLIQPIQVDAHPIGNPLANYQSYLLTTILPGLLALMVLLLTIYNVGIELKEQTSRHWIESVNGDMTSALLGKVLPYTLWAMLLQMVGNFVLFDIMHFPLSGSLVAVHMTSLLVILAMQSVAVFLVGILPVLRDAISIGTFYGMLGLSLSGFSYPATTMLPPVRAICNIFPLRHYYMIYSNEAILGNGMSSYWIHVVCLLAFLILPVFTHNRLRNAFINQNFPLK